MRTFDYLEIASAIVPDRACLIFEGARSTFAEVRERAERLARGLCRLGLTKGDRIAFLQVNCPQCVEAYYATAMTGAIFVPLNFRAKQEELSYMINHSGSKALLVGERYRDLVKTIRPLLKSVEHIIALDFKAPGFLSYESLFVSDGVSPGVTVDDEDITVLLYTSGTTGHPKGVPISHASFASYILQNVEPASPDSEETNILTVPLYHVAGFQAMLAANYGGRTLALMRQFETREWLETVQKERANRAMLVPTMLKRVIDYENLDRYDLSSLKVITYGSAPMTPEIITKAIKIMPDVHFINAFGQTETASTITMLGPEDHLITGSKEEKAKKLRRLGSSIGRPLPDVEIKIIDETGIELAAGEVGEIVARGPRVMSGYWNDPQKTASAIDREGWLHTGDLGYL